MPDGFKIKKRFQELWRDLSETEYKALEQSILFAGEIKEPVEIWNDFIVDGHHRYKVWKKNKDKLRKKDIPVRVLDLPSEDHVVYYIRLVQEGRRNATQAELRKSAGQRYNMEKEGISVSREGTSQAVSSSGGGRAASKIAKETGLSERTVVRAGAKEKRIEKLDKSLQRTIENANKEPGDDQIRALSELTPEQQSKVARLVRTDGVFWDDAIKDVVGKSREAIVADSKKKAAAKTTPAKAEHPLAGVVKTMKASRTAVGTAIDRVSDEWREPLKKAKSTGVLSMLKEIEKQLNGAYEGMGDLIRIIGNEKKGTS